VTGFEGLTSGAEGPARPPALEGAVYTLLTSAAMGISGTSHTELSNVQVVLQKLKVKIQCILIDNGGVKEIVEGYRYRDSA
jgi:hypothetical protein